VSKTNESREDQSLGIYIVAENPSDCSSRGSPSILICTCPMQTYRVVTAI
jgi:hypothetical protein